MLLLELFIIFVIKLAKIFSNLLPNLSSSWILSKVNWRNLKFSNNLFQCLFMLYKFFTRRTTKFTNSPFQEISNFQSTKILKLILNLSKMNWRIYKFMFFHHGWSLFYHRPPLRPTKWSGSGQGFIYWISFPNNLWPLILFYSGRMPYHKSGLWCGPGLLLYVHAALCKVKL